MHPFIVALFAAIADGFAGTRDPNKAFGWSGAYHPAATVRSRHGRRKAHMRAAAKARRKGGR
jgi:hypothetical protein